MDLLVDPVLLERRAACPRAARPWAPRSGATSRTYVHDLVVDARRVGDERLELLVGEQVAHHPHRELGLLVQDVGRLDLLRLLLDRRPIARSGAAGRAVMASSEAPSAAVRTITPCSAGFTFFRIVLSRLRSSSGSRRLMPERFWFGREHEEAARQGDLRREARALAAHRVLRDLHHHGLARLQHLLDARRVAFQVLGRVVDLAGVQHAVAAAADVDERGLHARAARSAPGPGRRCRPSNVAPVRVT